MHDAFAGQLVDPGYLLVRNLPVCLRKRAIDLPFQESVGIAARQHPDIFRLADQRRIGRDHLAELGVGFSRKKGVRGRTLRPVGWISAEDLIESRIGELLVIGLRQRVRASVPVGVDLLRIEGNRQLDRGLKESRPAIADDGREQDDKETKPDGDRGKAIDLEPYFCPAAAAHERGIIEAAGSRGSGEIGHGWVVMGEDTHSYCSRYFRTM